MKGCVGICLIMDKIINTKAEDYLLGLPSEYIDLTVTSPPYDKMRDYNSLFDLDLIAKQLYRTTKNGGACVWIVGDATIDGGETGTSFKQALKFIENGWKLFDTMIYAKPPRGAVGNNKTYWQSFEYMFVFSKGKPRTFNPIMENSICYGMKHYWGDTKRETKAAVRTGNKKTPVCRMKIKTNCWEYAVGGITDNGNHPAVYPEQLAKDQIISWSNEGDIIFDPFMGSGTTAKMAFVTGRKYIGFEISKEYCGIANKRLENVKSQLSLFNDLQGAK